MAFVILMPSRSKTGGGVNLSLVDFFCLCPRPPTSKVKNSRPLSTYILAGIPYSIIPLRNAISVACELGLLVT